MRRDDELKSRKGEQGSVMLVSLFFMVVLSLLGVAFLTLSNTESFVAANALWAEGAFQAGDAGVQAGLDQLSPNVTAATAAIPLTTIGTNYQYRSGRRTDTAPQPIQFVRSGTSPGYSIETGTGYNPSGYVFYVYQINATGTGPRNATREIEVQAEVGPVAQ